MNPKKEPDSTLTDYLTDGSLIVLGRKRIHVKLEDDDAAQYAINRGALMKTFTEGFNGRSERKYLGLELIAGLASVQRKRKAENPRMPSLNANWNVKPEHFDALVDRATEVVRAGVERVYDSNGGIQQDVTNLNDLKVMKNLLASTLVYIHAKGLEKSSAYKGEIEGLYNDLQETDWILAGINNGSQTHHKGDYLRMRSHLGGVLKSLEKDFDDLQITTKANGGRKDYSQRKFDNSYTPDADDHIELPVEHPVGYQAASTMEGTEQIDSAVKDLSIEVDESAVQSMNDATVPNLMRYRALKAKMNPDNSKYQIA